MFDGVILKAILPKIKAAAKEKNIVSAHVRFAPDWSEFEYETYEYPTVCVRLDEFLVLCANQKEKTDSKTDNTTTDENRFPDVQEHA